MRIVWEDVLLSFRGSENDKCRTWICGLTLVGGSRGMGRMVPDLRLQNCTHMAWRAGSYCCCPWQTQACPHFAADHEEKQHYTTLEGGGHRVTQQKQFSMESADVMLSPDSLPLQTGICQGCKRHPYCTVQPWLCSRTGWTQTVQTQTATVKARIQYFLESWHGHQNQLLANPSSQSLSSVSPSLISVTSGHRLFLGSEDFRKEVGVETVRMAEKRQWEHSYLWVRLSSSSPFFYVLGKAALGTAVR